MKKGFTLSEMIITIGIIGVISALTLPAINGMMPNKELLMFRKAYYLAERTVAELVNDEILYPPTGEDVDYLGNTAKVRHKGNSYGSDNPNGDNDAKARKFCGLFASYFNATTNVNCSNLSFTDNTLPGNGTFRTADNMVWILPVDLFQDNTRAREILVDVNGDKGPNCEYEGNLNARCTNPDRLRIHVYQDGRIQAGGDMEKEYLTRVNTNKNAKVDLTKLNTTKASNSTETQTNSTLFK